jgi:membrane-associated phospholipid phosphatase
MRRRLLVLAFAQLLVVQSEAVAQTDTVSHSGHDGLSGLAWIEPLGIAVSTALDPEIREWAHRQQSHSLDHLARLANRLGTARTLVPAMALTYGAAALTGRESLANGTLKTAAAYIASDLVESALKPVIGRERPHVSGNSHRFHPFTSNGDWHSLPSAHVAHIASIAEAISLQTKSTPVMLLCDGLVSLVAWDRVYEDQHWTSDVAVTLALTNAVSRATIHWLESRKSH